MAAISSPWGESMPEEEASLEEDKKSWDMKTDLWCYLNFQTHFKIPLASAIANNCLFIWASLSLGFYRRPSPNWEELGLIPASTSCGNCASVSTTARYNPLDGTESKPMFDSGGNWVQDFFLKKVISKATKPVRGRTKIWTQTLRFLFLCPFWTTVWSILSSSEKVCILCVWCLDAERAWRGDGTI